MVWGWSLGLVWGWFWILILVFVFLVWILEYVSGFEFEFVSRFGLGLDWF